MTSRLLDERLNLGNLFWWMQPERPHTITAWTRVEPEDWQARREGVAAVLHPLPLVGRGSFDGEGDTVGPAILDDQNVDAVQVELFRANHERAALLEDQREVVLAHQRRIGSRGSGEDVRIIALVEERGH